MGVSELAHLPGFGAAHYAERRELRHAGLVERALSDRQAPMVSQAVDSAMDALLWPRLNVHWTTARNLAKPDREWQMTGS
jgi:hypothetical protein